MVAPTDDVLVAHCAVTRVNASPRRGHVATMTCAVDPGLQRSGIGSVLRAIAVSQAFDWYAFTRSEITVLEVNQAALRLYLANLFKQEGVHPKHCLHVGEFHTALTFARAK